MTTLSILGGDWTYEFEDEFVTGGTGRVGTRMLRYVSGAVRTTQTVYSALADALDEFQAMGFKNPMLPVTPNAYTMENQAFISRGSTEFLKEGTINADWTAVTTPDADGNGVLRVAYTETTPFDSGDIGREVITGAHEGTLLDFEVEPDGTQILWVRPSVSGTDIWDGSGAITCTGGTGAASAHVAATGGGTIQYTAIQAIGAVPTATEVYIVQNRIKLGNALDNTGFQFWATDPSLSLGIISVLIRTTSDGTTIQAGDLEVFARRYGALFDHFRLNVNAGGFSALPLASAPDINNTTGTRASTLSGASGTWDVGNGIYVGGTWATATARGVITVGGSGATPTIEYYLVGDLDDLSAATVTEYDFVTEADGDGTGTGGAPSNNPGGPLETGGTGGGDITYDFGYNSQDFDNANGNEAYSLTINCDAKGTGVVYESMKYRCSRGSDETFWVDTVSVPGEQYRGLEAAIYYDNPTGTLVPGEDLINETQTAQTMRLCSQNTVTTDEGVSQVYITVMDVQPSTITFASMNNDSIADSGGTDDIDVDTAGSGGAIVTITSPKASPFGTYTGTVIFGAQGVYFTNLGAGDAQNYILTDDLGTIHQPPNTITFSVTNTRAGDRILVARDTGVDGIIDKDQFGGMTAVAASSKTITVAGSIDAEVPQGSAVLYAPGFLRVVENALQEEHKYFYDSHDGVDTFTLRDITASAADAGTSATALVDATANFDTEAVEVGMLVQDTTNTGTYEVVTVTDGQNLVLRHLYGDNTFANLDNYTINETIQLYAVTDDIFDLILDGEEDTGTVGSPGTMSNTLIKTPAANFDVVVQVRLGGVGGILPFQLNQEQGDGNTSVTAVRTPDTIAT